MAPSKRNDNLAPLIVARNESVSMCERIRELGKNILFIIIEWNRERETAESVNQSARSAEAIRETHDTHDKNLRFARAYCRADEDRRIDTPPKRTLQNVPARRTCSSRCHLRRLFCCYPRACLHLRRPRVDLGVVAEIVAAVVTTADDRGGRGGRRRRGGGSKEGW